MLRYFSASLSRVRSARRSSVKSCIRIGRRHPALPAVALLVFLAAPTPARVVATDLLALALDDRSLDHVGLLRHRRTRVGSATIRRVRIGRSQLSRRHTGGSLAEARG